MLFPIAFLLFIEESRLGERLEKLAPYAAGLAFVEVVEIKEVDWRPSDGPLNVDVKFRFLKRTGATMESISIIKAPGGHSAPNSPPFKPHGPVKVDTFTKSGRYWVAFCSQYDWERFPQGVVRVWKESDAPKDLGEAVRVDHFFHQPQYDPESGFTHSHRIEKDKSSWRVRMDRGGKFLWERKLPGEKFVGEQFEGEYGLLSRAQWPNGIEHADKNKSGRYLFAETTAKLPPANSFGLKADQYRLTYALDADSGKTAAIWVSEMRLGPTSTPSVVQYFDLKNGRLRIEVRFDLLEKGGVAAGGKEERWYRKLVRTYDAEAKRVEKEETFRYANTPKAGGYLPVDKR